jgi:hypothetical protein
MKTALAFAVLLPLLLAVQPPAPQPAPAVACQDDTWSLLLPLTNFPAIARFPTSVAGSLIWIGSEIFVWGTDPNGNAVAATAAYPPVSDPLGWQRCSAIGEPSPRLSPLLLWTGSEVAVLGGGTTAIGGSTPQGGALYNPATDSWRPINTTGEPFPVPAYAFVWTGSEIFLWTPVGIGLYNPSTDTWRSVSPPDIPLAQVEGVFAAWTGQDLLAFVAGRTKKGKGEIVGLIYHPATDAWNNASTVGFPSTVELVSPLVWTGTVALLVSSDGLGGGRYDPVTNSWAPITPPPAGVVSALSSFVTQAWTGTELMLVTVGSAETTGVNLGGGRYDPLTDTWRTVSSVTNGPSYYLAVPAGQDVVMILPGLGASEVYAYCSVPPPPQPSPEIDAIAAQGKNLAVAGENFDAAPTILVNGAPQITISQGIGELLAKKALKGVIRGTTVQVQVINANGLISTAVAFTRP